ncbi:uncharacterized protein L3040_002871 [Drepanopeziza brunnea f. sp. 'multigermtubi']|uniref:uncharacterized protein n=1 Tax=Drepanopeziza brunnea f. sp. 'multigermtubi' TaxID=698441 RepID=UPI00238A8E9E|nr:hypothetical protein L3040_002871 [Drepanopeziza brunnea f. sp. 'multigermtubi']
MISHSIAPLIGGAPFLFIFFLVWWLHHEPTNWRVIRESVTVLPSVSSGKPPSSGQSDQIPLPGQTSPISPELRPHKVLSSLSTANKQYFPIIFGDKEGINPSILPHPQFADTYIIIAQQQRSTVNNTVWFAQLVCNAKFTNDALACIESPVILPIAATPAGNCKGELVYFNFSVGPHDARAFYGPDGAYVIYGSNSLYTCFGQWMQDLRMLTDWGNEFVRQEFRMGTELRRHKPWGRVEKNWFVFWDKDDKLYVHWDIQPRRAFAKLNSDGSVGRDLAKYAKTDKLCMDKYMPPTGKVMEDLHQATNSLSITTCNRQDANCVANDANTFIITIFHFKSFHMFHGVYEPYVMMMQRHAPFALHAIGAKPLWISGRGEAGQGKLPAQGWDEAAFGPWNQTEMVFVTSISWKAHGSKYHGYADDTLFLGFGVEDETTGGIDIRASDLLADLNVCEKPPQMRGIGGL